MTHTVYIGLGGFGSRVVVALKKACPVNCLIIDGDPADLHQISKEGDIPGILLGMNQSAQQYLAHNAHREEICQWLPMHPCLLHTPMAQQHLRSYGRLSFQQAVEEGSLDPLKQHLFAPEPQRLQVIVIASLSGSSGSGMIIPLAQYLRTLAIGYGTEITLCGCFAGAELLVDAYPYLQQNRAQLESLMANTYAALRELEYWEKPLYDHIHLWGLEPAERTGRSYEEHINRATQLPQVKLWLENRLPNAVSWFDPNALPRPVAYERAYEHLCHRCVGAEAEIYNPHIDKRLLNIFRRPE